MLEDRGELLTVRVKPNFPVLGKKAGGAMKAIAARIGAMPGEEVRAALAGGGLILDVDGGSYRLTEEDLVVEESGRAPWAAAADAGMVVAVDTQLDDELRAEGLVRELAHRIQALRKSADFEVTDRIRLTLELSPHLEQALGRHEDYIREEVLATEVVRGGIGGGPAEEWSFDGERARVAIERVREGG
jgi:isoleucyl-tRNA synthetase